MGYQVVGQKLIGKITKPRPEFDLYTTPVPVVERMLRELYHHVKANNVYEVLDPCAGNGAFHKAIKNVYPYWKVTNKDIVQRKYPVVVEDFLTAPVDKLYDIVMMNPPYVDAVEFVTTALNHVREGGIVVAFLKLDFLGSKKRHELFKKNHLRHVIVNVERVTCLYNDDPAQTHGGTTETGWFIFSKSPSGNLPTISWSSRDGD